MSISFSPKRARRLARPMACAAVAAAGLAVALPVNPFELSSIDGTNGLHVRGIDENDFAGRSVASVGDFNGDGVDDYLVTAPYGDAIGMSSGEAYLIFGSAAFGTGADGDPLSADGDLNAASLNGENGFVINGNAPGILTGFSAAGAGDINGDGFDDLIIGAIYADPVSRLDAGRATVILGASEWGRGTDDDPLGGGSDFSLGQIDGENGFHLNGASSYDFCGWDVDGGEDINGDGLDDMIVGSWLASPNGPASGRAHVIFGNTDFGTNSFGDPTGFGNSLDLSVMTPATGFALDGAAASNHAGSAVALIGDINNDGVGDIAVGAPRADVGAPSVGLTYVLFGTPSFHDGTPADPLGGAASLNLGTLAPPFGFVIEGAGAANQAGSAIAGGADISGDGIDDFVISAPEADVGAVYGQREGKSYVIFGNADFATGAGTDPVIFGNLLLANLGSNGATIEGQTAIDLSGSSVAAGADLDGDGTGEFLVGVPKGDVNGMDSGEPFLFVNFGFQTGTFSLASAPGTLGVEVRGEFGSVIGGDEAGFSSDMGGDANGDGRADFILGAPRRVGPTGINRAGGAYIIYGTPPADTTPPTVVQVTTPEADGLYPAGSVLEIRLIFDEPVLVDSTSGTPNLTLNNGGTATLTSGSGTNTLRFFTTVGPGEDTPDLNVTALNLNGGTITDAALNAAGLTLPAGPDSLAGNHDLEIDATAPFLTFFDSTTPDGTYSAGDAVNVRAFFSETISYFGGATGAELDLDSGGTAVFTSASSAQIDFTYNVLPGEDSPDLDVTTWRPGTSLVEDIAGNTADLTLPSGIDTLAARRDIVIDGSNPFVLDISTPDADGAYRTGQVITIDVQFNEGVTIDTSGGSPVLTLNNGATAAFDAPSGGDTFRFLYAIAGGEDTADLDVTTFSANGAVIEDGSSLGAILSPLPAGTESLAGGHDIEVDTVAPQVTGFTSPDPDGVYGPGAVLTVEALFSEPVTGSGTPALDLNSGGSASFATQPAADTAEFSYTVASPDSAADLDVSALDLAGGTFADAAGNTLSTTLPGAPDDLASQKNIAIDTASPAIASITSTAPDGSYTAAAVIDIVVNFTEPVTFSSTPPVLSLNSGGNASYLSGNGSSAFTFRYTVADGENTADLDAALWLFGPDAQDDAGNALSTTLPAGANSLAGARNIVIDTAEPVIVSLSTATPNGTYTTGEVIEVVATFNEAVTVTPDGTAPRLTLNTGGVAEFDSQPAADQIRFLYTVSAGEGTSDLDVTGSELDTATIEDTAGNGADLTLPASPDTFAELYDIAVDTGAPVIIALTSTPPTEDYGPGETLSILMEVSEPVTVGGGVPSLALDSGGTATYTGLPAANVLEFTYTVLAGEDSADLDATGFSFNGAAITDGGSNALSTGLPSGASSLAGGQDIIIDTTAPVPALASVDVTDGSTIGGPPSQAFTATFTDVTAVSGFDPSDPADLRVVNGSISGISQSGNTWTFTVTPVADGAVELEILAAAAVDNVGNTSTASPVFSYTFDTTVPSAQILTAVAPNGGVTNTAPPWPVTARFFTTTGISGFDSTDPADFALTNAAPSAATQNGEDYDFTVTPTADGTVTMQVRESAAQDGLSRDNAASPVYTITYDTTAPVVTLASNDVADGATVNAPAEFVFTATFSDATAVSGWNPATDLALTNATASGGSLAGNVYTFTVTPDGDGPVSVEVADAAVQDAAGNTSTGPVTYSFTYDTTAPDVTLASPDVADGATVNSPSSFVFTATFADTTAVSGWDPATDLSLTNATASSGSLTGDVYTFTVTPSADGPVSVQVADAAIQDAAGNPSTGPVTYGFIYDTTAPEIALESFDVASGALVNSPAEFDFRLLVTDVTGLQPFDAGASVALTNATLVTSAQAPGEITFTIAPDADGVVSFLIDGSALIDAAGNTAPAPVAFSFTYDATGPAPVLTSPAVTNGGTFTGTFDIEFIADFSDVTNVTGFDALDPADLALTNASVFTAPGKAGLTSNFRIVPDTPGLVTLQIPAGAATDEAGNASTSSPVFEFTWDPFANVTDWQDLDR